MSSIAELKLPLSGSSYFVQTDKQTSPIPTTSLQSTNVAVTKSNKSQKNSVMAYSIEQSVEQVQVSDGSKDDLYIASADKMNGIEIPHIDQEIFVGGNSTTLF